MAPVSLGRRIANRRTRKRQVPSIYLPAPSSSCRRGVRSHVVYRGAKWTRGSMSSPKENGANERMKTHCSSCCSLMLLLFF